ncbi:MULTISPECIES: MarR family winged helix-turn-helix transcriptional regulator [Glutamicibacter]|uniref:MarR family transcriptional regulator n=1 Tax=Glutamicibacter halophytocola TaxID=1933880 RepID=A0ABX5YBR3_9MICC|nr:MULTISPECIES: MarR family transcriptional regulator [Glutamicibacter]MBF6672093.1 MarR family transcriptional regulator [Glutamicibacter sp. FBE19]NQD41608.1 MarR family transcriptional regulator [Glutamicibacter halophytocola]QDY67101.1 MarR family transcriptional regulator [Glutamicibacter halophytocola]
MNAQRPLGYWLKLVDSLIDEQFAATLEEHGVTRRQWQVLNLLEQQPATEAQLNAGLSPFFASEDEPQSLNEHLAELVESGWVTVHDGEYSITDRGHISLLKLSELVEKIRTQFGQDLDGSEYDAVVQTLEKIARSLGWDPEQAQQ